MKGETHANQESRRPEAIVNNLRQSLPALQANGLGAETTPETLHDWW
jgi:hypothetical protein